MADVSVKAAKRATYSCTSLRVYDKSRRQGSQYLLMTLIRALIIILLDVFIGSLFEGSSKDECLHHSLVLRQLCVMRLDITNQRVRSTELLTISRWSKPAPDNSEQLYINFPSLDKMVQLSSGWSSGV